MAEVSNEMLLQVQRLAAWERAKGELRAILEMYVGNMESFNELADAVEEFIAKVDDNSLGGLS